MNRKSDLLLHPVRLRLVTELAGRQMTTRELALSLPDIPQATLYRHVKRLLDESIFEVAAETVVNGAVEKTYRVAAGQNRLTPDEMEALPPEEHVRYFNTFTAALIDAFTRYVEHSDPANFGRDGMSYNRAAIYLTPDERAAFQEKIIALVEQVMNQGPAPGRERYLLASIVIPE